MNRFKIALIIAGAATLAEVIGFIILFAVNPASKTFLSEFQSGLILLGILAGIVSFFFAGIGSIFRSSWRIARWGFIAAPFPLNLIFVLMTFVAAFVALIFIPIIPVFSTYRAKRREGMVY